MDEVWERAVETALDGESDGASARSLTLDGAVKCIHGRLPPPSLLEKFQSLEHLSIANVGVSSLEKFPRLRNLQKLILSDNRIAGGLEHLVDAGLDSLRDLDLSNNRIQFLEDLTPLADLKLVSLDLYECPVTRIKDYRVRVFAMIRSLKYLDKMDVEENERPESDEEEEDEDEEEEDPGEVDGEERLEKMNGDVDDDGDEDDDGEDSDEGVDDDDGGGDERGENGTVEWSSEEIDEEEDVGNVEVHEVDDSEEEDGVEEDEDDDEEDDGEDEEDGGEAVGPVVRAGNAEGEIDGHEQGEEDENGEIGEEDGEGVEEDGEYEEDDGVDEEDDFGAAGYLVQPIGQTEAEEANGSDLEPGNEEDGEDEQDVEDEDDLRFQQRLPSSSQQPPKRKRDGEEDDDDDDGVEDGRSSKRH